MSDIIKWSRIDDIIGNVERSIESPAYQWRSYMSVALQIAAGQLNNVAVVSNGEIGVLSLCAEHGASFLGGPVMIERKEIEGDIYTLLYVTASDHHEDDLDLQEVARYKEPREINDIAAYYCKIALEAVSFYLVVSTKASLGLCERHYKSVLSEQSSPIVTRSGSLEAITELRSALNGIEAHILTGKEAIEIDSDEFES